jgi:hypothetical protein
MRAWQPEPSSLVETVGLSLRTISDRQPRVKHGSGTYSAQWTAVAGKRLAIAGTDLGDLDDRLGGDRPAARVCEPLATTPQPSVLTPYHAVAVG